MAVALPTCFPSFCLPFDIARPLRPFANRVYQLVCRTDFDAPGFCLIDLGADCGSVELRRFMVAFKGELADIHRRQSSRDLVYISASRFDQQTTTKLHRDSGPDESMLMLGYEQSEVPAVLTMADYARCAFDLGISARQFLDDHNPMFKTGQRLLDPYLSPVECFRHDHANVLLVNNSMADELGSWKGVLHTATIPRPDEAKRRVINSTLLASVPADSPAPLSADQLDEFLTTTVVRR